MFATSVMRSTVKPGACRLLADRVAKSRFPTLCPRRHLGRKATALIHEPLGNNPTCRGPPRSARFIGSEKYRADGKPRTALMLERQASTRRLKTDPGSAWLAAPLSALRGEYRHRRRLRFGSESITQPAHRWRWRVDSIWPPASRRHTVPSREALRYHAPRWRIDRGRVHKNWR